jgi:hypothetical protein
MAGVVDAIDPTMQTADTTLLLGGANAMADALRKERAWLNRLLLRHIIAHEYPVSCLSCVPWVAH